MNQKNEKPTLSGQRIKTRKRDEKEKNDPIGFRDSIIQGLDEAGTTDVELIYRFLDTAGSKLDYRRYGEVLFDILIAGGILAPGGSLLEDAGDSKPFRTDGCIFMQEDSMEEIKPFALVFIKLMRRYKYLEKMFGEEVQKVLLFIRGFSEKDRQRLAKALAVWISQGAVTPSVLTPLLQEHLVRDGLAAEFIVNLFVAWRAEKDIQAVKSALRKAGLDCKLMEFFPSNKRSKDHAHTIFREHGLGEIVDFHLTQASAELRKELQVEVDQMLQDGETNKEIISLLKPRQGLEERDAILIIWNGIMNGMEWNKKEELVADQALKRLRAYTPLFAAFTTNGKSEISLLNRVQEFCFENINFHKVFSKIVMLFYKTEVLSEGAILKWYKESHSQKGKTLFLEQVRKFVEWLQNAEEESDSGEEEENNE